MAKRRSVTGIRLTRAYQSWRGMRERCANPRHKDWKYYGGKGIRICARWDSFESFYEDMGERAASYTLDRIDSNKNYSPDNCRWADAKTQSNNRSGRRVVTVGGKDMTLAQAAEKFGISFLKAFKRLKRGWTPDQTFGVEYRKPKTISDGHHSMVIVGKRNDAKGT